MPGTAPSPINECPEGIGHPLILLAARGKGPEKGEESSGKEQHYIQHFSEKNGGGRRAKRGCPGQITGHEVRSPGI